MKRARSIVPIQVVRPSKVYGARIINNPCTCKCFYAIIVLFLIVSVVFCRVYFEQQKAPAEIFALCLGIISLCLGVASIVVLVCLLWVVSSHDFIVV